jgi:hypothetical protein
MKMLYTFYCWICDFAWTEVCKEKAPEKPCHYCNRLYKHEDVVSKDDQNNFDVK